ncbi:MAG: transglutaminase domain-containing protein [Acidobacteria bacterium]|nr:transglutaminase domain-containing protein [Acidobacteriota bacterium]
MSSSSLFDSESQKSSSWKMLLIGFLVLVVVFGAAFGLYWRSIPKEKTDEERLAEQIRDSTVLMLAQPTFSGDEFAKQILGKARFQWLDRKKREAYFSYPPAEAAEFDEFLNKYFADPKKIEMATEKNGKLLIGDFSLALSENNKYFLKTSVDNVRIDPHQTLSFPFKGFDYTLSLEEMKGYTDDTWVYGGKLVAEASTESRKPRIIFANHGIMVAKPGEPSLKRVVDELLKDETIANDREKRVQRILDFVSNEIEYSYTEAVSPRETLKRADEILMTRIGDCSNKTILLASLLEQIGEDYILIYCPRHITVAVAQGNFPNDNKLDFTYENKKYLIAESTMPGFQIGKSRVQQSDILNNVNYVQSPRQIDLIFDAKSYNYLNFW